jgi:hypothetical protein
MGLLVYFARFAAQACCDTPASTRVTAVAMLSMLFLGWYGSGEGVAGTRPWLVLHLLLLLA